MKEIALAMLEAAAEIDKLRREKQVMQSRLESLEKDCEELIKERDEREDVINELLNQVLCDERKEWSSAYDFTDAVIDVECKMKSLENDAARWNEVANGDSPFLGVVYVDDFGNERWLMGCEAEKAVDTAMQANKGE